MDLRVATSSEVIYSSGMERSTRADALTWSTSLRGIPTTTWRILIMSSFSASWTASLSFWDAFMGLAIMLERMPSEGVSL